MCQVLILDDDPEYGKKLAYTLERRSQAGRRYHVQATHEIEVALDEARRAVQAGKPYDVFLIDQKLGPGMNGIEVMEQLFAISPKSGAMIFTGLEDPLDGLSATKAGAYKYLLKPIHTEELLMHLNALEDAQKTQRERDWLQTFTEIAERSLGCASYQATAETIAEGALRLGFDRALIFRYDGDAPEALAGVCQAGDTPLENFTGQAYAICDWALFEQARQAADIHIFKGQEAPGFARPPAGGGKPGASKRDGEGALLPLWIGERFVGALALINFTMRRQFRTEERQQLQLLARIAAGNLERVRLYEAENIDKRRLALLQSASEKLLDIVNQDEEKFWRTLLTLATADYALGFNRAWVFLAEAGNTRLRGMLGIGHLDREHARRAWERDVATGMDFDHFLEALHNGKLQRTPMERLTRHWTLELGQDGDGFRRALQTSRPVICFTEQDAVESLPEAFVRRFQPGPCAILPLRAGAVNLGVVVVDNKHNHIPINPSILDRLETFLNIAGLAWQDHQQNKERDALLEAAYAVMGNVGMKPLGETLRQICEAARTVTGADDVIIYPLKNSSEPFVYDVVNIGAAGKAQVTNVKEKPRQKSVSAQILRGGPMLVDDIRTETTFGGLMDLSKHHFIQREGVRAMIGVPVTGIEENQNLGVLYLNYRAPQRFTHQERKQAEAFANLASIAILNTRNAEETRHSLEKAWSHDEQSQRELGILYQVLKEALTHISEEWLTKTLLHKVQELLNQTGLDPMLILHRWDHLEWDHEPAEEYQCRRLNANDRLVAAALTPEEHALVAELFEGGDWRYTREGHLYTAIRPAEAVIGALRVTLADPRSAPMFQPMLKRFASAAGVALDNARRQEHLLGVLEAAKAVAAPISLAKTFEAIIQTARQVSPDMSALTLWHRDPETGELRLARYFGLRSLEQIESVNPSPENLVWRVMELHEPEWLSGPDPNHWLVNRFIRREGVVSTAAFPLRANGDRIGALFFNYRRKHVFSDEEKVIFKILAEVAATSIRDAQRLESEQKESMRLQVVLDTSKAIGAMLDLNELFRTVLARLSETFPNTIPCLLTYNRDDRSLEFTQASREIYPIDNPALLGWGELRIDKASVACRVARRTLAERSIVLDNVPDVRQDPDYVPAVHSTRSELCVSLCDSAGELLGVFLLERARVKGFEYEDEALAKAIAQQISLAIERAQQSAELNFSQTVATWTAWAADMAHDFNRALGAIRHHAYLLKETAGVAGAEAVRRYADEIETNAELLSAGNPSEQARQWIQPDKLIAEWAGEVIAKRGGKVSVKTELNCSGVFVIGNETVFRRILGHLTRNAAEALAQQERGVISIQTRLTGDRHMEIVFGDNGPGVAGHLRTRVLYQHIPHEDSPGGYGLLLTRQMVKNMDGSISLLPQRDQAGAEFLIRLPIRTSLAAEAAAGMETSDQENRYAKP